jgi:hypothetical protein
VQSFFESGVSENTNTGEGVFVVMHDRLEFLKGESNIARLKIEATISSDRISVL